MFFACKVWCIAVVSSISPSSEQTLCTLPFEIALEQKCCIKSYEKSSLKTVTCSSLPIFLCNRIYFSSMKCYPWKHRERPSVLLKNDKEKVKNV